MFIWVLPISFTPKSFFQSNMIFSFTQTHQKMRKKFNGVVIFMGTGVRHFVIVWLCIVLCEENIWKQMTSSCKYIDHTSYSQALDFCNQCNEVDWSQFEIKYNLDITRLPQRNFYDCRGIFCVYLFRKEYKRMVKNQGNKTRQKERSYWWNDVMAFTLKT